MKFIYILFLAVTMISCEQHKENAPEEIDDKLNEHLIEIIDNEDTRSLKDDVVLSKEMADQIATIVLSSYFGRKRIMDQKPFAIRLVNDTVWRIDGKEDENLPGGSSHMFLNKKSGKVMSVFATQ